VAFFLFLALRAILRLLSWLKGYDPRFIALLAGNDEDGSI